jgi:hypothetical protein
MPMSRLASRVYRVLRGLVPDQDAEITYADLVLQLGKMAPPNQDLRPRDKRLADALGEIVAECRSRKLPVLSAIVVRRQCRTPGPGYFRTVHPDVAHDTARAMIAWGNEVLKVRRKAYPEVL